ncbi:MAG TPA: hypothetical protein VE954_22700 [Oligoflexus sp.]|uniref:hypothetical protein n=1 Tax=Oligoflexus sp. TaxID=1971216 RepID=UPI002D4D7690|nr:hypothetical protein [Oligoflexus sp.]HYX35920.1 hypothetical protein [Oligoflexus sp.]
MQHFKLQLGSTLISLVVGKSVYAEEPLSKIPKDIAAFELIDVILGCLEKETVSFSYDTGAYGLNSEHKAKLDSVVPLVKSDKFIYRVVVLAWPDQFYPLGHDKKLSDGERKLADKRADEILRYLNSKSVFNVEIYKVTDGQDWFTKFLTTENPRLQGEYARVANQARERIFRVIETKGGPSKAIVYFIRDAKNLSMPACTAR